MHLTIISYRPNHDDYWMGSCMGRSDSELIIEHTTLSREASRTLGYYMFQNDIKSLEEADYDFTLLQNGIDSDDQHYDRVLSNDIFEEAAVIKETYLLKHREKEAARKCAAEKKEADDQELKDRAELARLQAKLHEVNDR